ncbi:hypothetical protein CMV_017310 [Castanea mollissima]|uniref:Uncharacterized protein n=1 Tax=Castanea mollissima TaxID=60419 RepID=A0A8J4R538_9ROSI|nr:hypothetical protein CMV_017310 [Castanea mollissima]
MHCAQSNSAKHKMKMSKVGQSTDLCYKATKERLELGGRPSFGNLLTLIIKSFSPLKQLLQAPGEISFSNSRWLWARSASGGVKRDRFQQRLEDEREEGAVEDDLGEYDSEIGGDIGIFGEIGGFGEISEKEEMVGREKKF